MQDNISGYRLQERIFVTIHGIYCITMDPSDNRYNIQRGDVASFLNHCTVEKISSTVYGAPEHSLYRASISFIPFRLQVSI